MVSDAINGSADGAAGDSEGAISGPTVGGAISAAEGDDDGVAEGVANDRGWAEIDSGLIHVNKHHFPGINPSPDLDSRKCFDSDPAAI